MSYRAKVVKTSSIDKDFSCPRKAKNFEIFSPRSDRGDIEPGCGACRQAGILPPPSGKSRQKVETSKGVDARMQLACVVPLLIVVDADPISACKGKSGERRVELGDSDPPPAENLRSPSRPPHVIFSRCFFTTSRHVTVRHESCRELSACPV